MHLSRVACTIVALLAVASAATPASAQHSFTVDGRRLVPRTDSLAIFYVADGDTTRTGTVRDELALVEQDGRQLLRRVYATVDGLLGTRSDTLVDDAVTLLPVRHRSRTERGREALDFAGDGVAGWLWLANGDSLEVRTMVPAGVFNASSFDLVLRASDLREGWSAVLPVFLPHARAVAPLPAHVTGVETAGGEPCWRVDAVFSGMPVTFWIGQRSRALRQQVMQLRPGVAILFRAFATAGPTDRAT